MEISDHLRYLAKNIRRQDITALTAGLGLQLALSKSLDDEVAEKKVRSSPEVSKRPLLAELASELESQSLSKTAHSGPEVTNPFNPETDFYTPPLSPVSFSASRQFAREKKPVRAKNLGWRLGKGLVIIAIDAGFILSSVLVLALAFFSWGLGSKPKYSQLFSEVFHGLAILPVYEALCGFLIISGFYVLLFRFIVGATLGEALIPVGNKTKRHYNKFI